jgi:hypothetical protein
LIGDSSVGKSCFLLRFAVSQAVPIDAHHLLQTSRCRSYGSVVTYPLFFPLCSSRTTPMWTATSARLVLTLWVGSSWNVACILGVFSPTWTSGHLGCSLIYWPSHSPGSACAENPHDRDGGQDHKAADCKWFPQHFFKC